MKKIVRAENAGFCFGVRQAIEKAEEAAKKSDENIYSMGPLIHNERVTGDLEREGVKIISSLDEVRHGDVVIIRSHGEGKSFYDEAGERGISLIDATCPFVAKIHKLVHDTDKQVVIVGDKDHPEVIGIFGWCRKPAIVVSRYDEAAAIESDDLFIVTQTTIREEVLQEVVKALTDSGKTFYVNNTICSATTKRQESCEKLAKESDLMIVIGGRKSSNTKKLCEISKNSAKTPILLKILKIYR